jgi:hypothetical protein
MGPLKITPPGVNEAACGAWLILANQQRTPKFAFAEYALLLSGGPILVLSKSVLFFHQVTAV